MKEERRKEIWKEYRKDLKDLGKRIVERRKKRTGKWWGRRKEIRAEKGKKEVMKEGS
jgi:hypothetical protein